MKQLNSTLQQLAYPPPSSYILQDHENLPGTPYPHDSRQPSQLRAFQNRRSDSRSCSQSTYDSPGVDQRSRKSSQDQNYLSPPNTIRQTRAASFNSPPAENNSAVSSTMTVYYPLKSGEQDGVRNNLPMHKRTRTSTLGIFFFFTYTICSKTRFGK
jgi:hypothetical protein